MVKSDEYLTPPEIVGALGVFDLDPCAPHVRPWDTARVHYSHVDDGLNREWFGRVWLNPPYLTGLGLWMKRMSEHGNGIAFLFVKTDTRIFHSYVWTQADALLFLRGRVGFHKVSGEKLKGASHPSCLVAYGKDNARTLKSSGIKGFYVDI